MKKIKKIFFCPLTLILSNIFLFLILFLFIKFGSKIVFINKIIYQYKYLIIYLLNILLYFILTITIFFTIFFFIYFCFKQKIENYFKNKKMSVSFTAMSIFLVSNIFWLIFLFVICFKDFFIKID
ncbi:MAG: putative secreted protein [Candidatus Phytoplasma cynodontis]|uniref:hypothetical protein n=1 Tax='Cynodon dactylon' phytoplasma TaxID=295320 RepID=UPI001265CAAF|nr:hypothetical protein ['Cynodon dactylon' phytoplasma]KAB8121795.1 hypothetical protein F1741_01545 ['Cynodon dactylon' phytoplasma]WIA07747.1 MAG: putative secreted protein [Candidatus Phytoplasma cynodontis]